jgi:isopenicillin N synthase-like dioxygenase
MAHGFPVFDLSRFGSADKAGRRALGVEVDRICRETGFLAISGHGVPQAVIDGVWSKARASSTCRLR